MAEEKIVISVGSVRRLVNLMKAEKEQLQKSIRDIEEKIVELEIEIEDIEDAIERPVPPLEKKEDDFYLTVQRVEEVIKKADGEISNQEIMDILVIDLNLDKKDRLVMKSLKGRVYQHCLSLLKKARIYQAWNQEKACKVYAMSTNLEEAQAL